MQELGFLNRLCDEVVGAFFDGFDGDFDSAVTSYQNDLDFMVCSLRALQQFDAVHDGQSQVRNQNVNALMQNDVESLLAVIGFNGLVSDALEDFQHRRAALRII